MNTACDNAPCLRIDLPTVADTLHFGAELGKALALAHATPTPLRTVLLYGDLGSGKTTLTRGVVAALPGGDKAEVSSPSFTVCNEYATIPRIVHCDVYRSDTTSSELPEEAEDALEDRNKACILVEWAQRLTKSVIPSVHLDIYLVSCQEKHSVAVIAHGDAALYVFQQLARAYAAAPQCKE